MLTTRDATKADVSLIADLIRACFIDQAELLGMDPGRHPRYVAFDTPDQVQERMEQGTTAIIAYLWDRAVGTVSVSLDRDDASAGYVGRLCILPEHRGKGFGLELMGIAESRLREMDARCIRLSLVAHFESLCRWYEDQGYVPGSTVQIHHLPFDVRHMEKPIA